MEADTRLEAMQTTLSEMIEQYVHSARASLGQQSNHTSQPDPVAQKHAAQSLCQSEHCCDHMPR
eukprot:3986017-Pleurochrysis_carterae.AAC.1